MYLLELVYSLEQVYSWMIIKTSLSIIFFSLFVSLPLTVVAQNRLSFEQSAISISTTQYGGFLIDSEGFIWIGPTGLGVLRYDGHELKSFTDQVKGRMISSIVEDKEGGIWIASFSNGITHYNKATGEFTNYTHSETDSNSLCSDNISFSPQKLFVDKNNILWVGTDDVGLCAYDKGADRWTLFPFDPSSNNGVNDNTVVSITEGSGGVLWIGTVRGGLNQYNKNNGKWTHYKHNPEDPKSISSNWIYSLLVDSGGVLWLGTKNGGLNRFNMGSNDFTHFKNRMDDETSISGNDVWSIYEDSIGSIWVTHMGSTISGLDALDKETGIFTRYAHNPKDPGSVGSNSVMRIFEDERTHTYWVVNFDGSIDRHDDNANYFKHWPGDPGNPNNLSDKSILPILEDRNGVVWVGTMAGGLNRIDRESGEITVFQPDPEDKRSIPNLRVTALAEDDDGVLWIGFWGGTLVSFDAEAGECINFYSHDSTDPASITENELIKYITQDRDDSNILWVASMKGGLDRFDKRKGEFTHYKTDPSDPHSISYDSLVSIYDDGDGVLWIATYGGGLNKFNKASEKFVAYRHNKTDDTSIGSNTIYEILRSSTDEYWISRKGGISLFDSSTGQFTNYNTDGEGHPFGPVGGLLEGDDGNIWFSTVGSGIVRFNPSTQAFKRYTQSDGLHGNTFFWNSSLKTASGELWFGGANGIESFTPASLKENPIIPRIVLTAFTQGGISLLKGVSPEKLQSVVLDWNKNYFEFRYAALNYAAPEKNQYAYMLEGWDEDWYQSGENPFGRYSGLTSGEYRLRLRGSNNDGVWNKEGKSILIKVTAPFWESSWFYGVLLLLLIVIMAAVMFYVVRLRQEISDRKWAQEGLRLSEAQFKSLSENSQDFIRRYDKDCRHLYQNAAAYKVSGFTEKEFVGKSLKELGFENDLCELWEYKINQVFRTKESASEIFELEGPDGVLFLDWRLFPEFGEDGTVDTVLAVSRDITENKNLESQLIQSQKMKALGTLTGGIAHDFNNLLSIIHGNVELIEVTSKLDDKSRSRLSSIMKATKRAAKLTKQLLGFSSRQATSIEITNINRVIEELDSVIERSLTPEISVNQNLATGLWSTEIDVGDFEDVLLNLLINARDAMVGGGKLCIETSNKLLDAKFCSRHAGLSPGEYVCLLISDTGAGIELDKIDQIFEPFFTTKPQGKGTGLGLAMVFGFAQRSRGHINVQSMPGEGATFKLYLPKSLSTVLQQAETEAERLEDPTGSETILVVDDEQGLREMVESLLMGLGYTVITATDGKQALSILKKQPGIDLLFSDVVMPSGVNGYELAEQVRMSNPRIKVLLTSGYVDKTITHAGHERFKANVLTKPYSLRVLAFRVRATLDS